MTDKNKESMLINARAFPTNNVSIRITIKVQVTYFHLIDISSCFASEFGDPSKNYLYNPCFLNANIIRISF